MANLRIVDLSNAATLTGTEQLEIVQGGNSKNTTAQDIANLAPGLGFTAENVSNKSTNVTTDGASDTKYPSVKSVKTYVDANTGLGYKVYSALISQTGGATMVVNQLKNTIGDGSGNGTTDLKFIDITGAIQIQMTTGSPFTTNKVQVFVGGIIGSDNLPYITTVNYGSETTFYISIFKYDGTDTATPVFANLSVEVRVYP